MKRVLAAIDYSEATLKIVEKAVELAKAFDADLILLHVLSDATYYSSLNYSPILGFDSSSNQDILQTSTIEELRNAATNFLNRIKEKANYEKTDIMLSEGDFGNEILKAATEKEADIIVIGTHSRKGIDKILMGSVTQKVTHKSEIPLYIVPIRNR